MKVNEQEKRKQMIAGVLGVLALILVSYQLYNLFGGSSTPPPQAAPVITTAGAPKPVATAGPAATKTGTASTQLDPTLHEEAMLVTESLVYSGTGRNIFSGTVEAPPPPPVKIAETKFPPRPAPAPGPVTQAVPVTPPLPPINLKFFGTDTAQNGTRRAFLLNGDDVFLASVGDVVERKYRVVSIAANSILVEDIPNSNKQTLPLTGN
jgi:hypothetical protein